MCDFHRAKWRFILRMRLLFNHIIADMLCIRSSPKFQLFCSRFLNPLSRITVYRLCTYFHRSYVWIVFTYKAVFFQNNLPMRNFFTVWVEFPKFSRYKRCPHRIKKFHPHLLQFRFFALGKVDDHKTSIRCVRHAIKFDRFFTKRQRIHAYQLHGCVIRRCFRTCHSPHHHHHRHQQSQQPFHPFFLLHCFGLSALFASIISSSGGKRKRKNRAGQPSPTRPVASHCNESYPKQFFQDST